ncbi:hypothetical protein [Hansschlegelia sp. KR7-227]|jgi:hypothetical protein|uniref:hypothetical protein n=1 Tax=Hansschlegelia sp. KR7-227 TaxID=3400914 RepID=UPI003C0CD34D
MKTLIAVAGALALTASVAQAETMYRTTEPAPVRMDAMGAAAPSSAGYSPSASYYESPSAGTAHPALGESPAAGFEYQNSTEARDRTPNIGAGTSRSSDANNG